MSIFGPGGRGEAAGLRINEGILSIRDRYDMPVLPQALLLNGPLDQDPRRPPRALPVLLA
jgi:hypothetical protein